MTQVILPQKKSTIGNMIGILQTGSDIYKSSQNPTGNAQAQATGDQSAGAAPSGGTGAAVSGSSSIPQATSSASYDQSDAMQRRANRISTPKPY